MSSSQYILFNIDDKADSFTKEENWLRLTNCSFFVTKWYLKMINLIFQQIDDLQRDTRAEYSFDLYIDVLRIQWYRRRKVNYIGEVKPRLNGSQTRWVIEIKVKLTKLKFWMIVVIWLFLQYLLLQRLCYYNCLSF